MSTLRQLLERSRLTHFAVDLGTCKLLTEYREMEGGIALFVDVNQYGDDITWEIPLDEEPSSDGQYGFHRVTVYQLVEMK